MATKIMIKLANGKYVDMSKAVKPMKPEDKVHKVMKEFKEGKLKSSSGHPVTSRDQAVAIAMSESGLSNKMVADIAIEYDDMEKATQLQTGTKIESEHKNTIKFIRNYQDKHGKLPPENEVYKHIAKDHLSEFKDYYTRLLAMEKEAEEDMQKAKANHKYIKRIPKPSGKGYIYFYTNQQVKEYKEKGVVPKSEKKEEKGWFDNVKRFFGLKTEEQVQAKIKSEYDKHKDKLTGINIADFSDHLDEYLSNKSKWDKKFFGEKKEKGEESKSKKESEKKEKVSISKERQKSGFDINIMRTIAGIYGGKNEIDKIKEKKPIDRSPLENAKLHDIEREKENKELKDRVLKRAEKLNLSDDEINKIKNMKPLEAHLYVQKKEQSQEDNFETMPEGEKSTEKVSYRDMIDTIKSSTGGSQKTGNLDWYLDEEKNKIMAYHSITGSKWGEINIENGNIESSNEEKNKDLEKIYNDIKEKTLERKDKLNLENLIKYPIRNKEEIKKIIKRNENKKWIKEYERFLPSATEALKEELGKKGEGEDKKIKNPEVIIGGKIVDTSKVSTETNLTGFFGRPTMSFKYDGYFYLVDKESGIVLSQDKTKKKLRENVQKQIDNAKVDKNRYESMIKERLELKNKRKEQIVEKDKEEPEKMKIIKSGEKGDYPDRIEKIKELAKKEVQQFQSEEYKKKSLKELKNIDKDFLTKDGKEELNKLIKQKESEEKIQSKDPQVKYDAIKQDIDSINDKIKNFNDFENFNVEFKNNNFIIDDKEISSDALSDIIKFGKENDINDLKTDAQYKKWDKIKEKLKDNETVNVAYSFAEHIYDTQGKDFLSAEEINKYAKNQKELSSIKEDLLGPKMFKALLNLRSELMLKAQPTKYIKRIPNPNGKGFIYFYTQEQVNEYNKSGKLPDDQQKKPEAKKETTGKSKIEILKEATKKVANIMAEALSGKDAVQPTGSGVEQTGENISAKSKEKKRLEKQRDISKDNKKKKPEDNSK